MMNTAIQSPTARITLSSIFNPLPLIKMVVITEEPKSMGATTAMRHNNKNWLKETNASSIIILYINIWLGVGRSSRG
jgi:hypothetical protein